jgi:hypothetical protein
MKKWNYLLQTQLGGEAGGKATCPSPPNYNTTIRSNRRLQQIRRKMKMEVIGTMGWSIVKYQPLSMDVLTHLYKEVIGRLTTIIV